MTRPHTPETFWAKVDRSGGPNACWPWLKYRSKFGHGWVKYQGSGWTTAHRIAYRLIHGTLSDDLDVLHRCDNPWCCNPAHLFTGVQADNNIDMAKKGRAHKKLTDDQVREIRTAHYAQWVLAERYGVGQQHISRLRRRTKRQHVI